MLYELEIILIDFLALRMKHTTELEFVLLYDSVVQLINELKLNEAQLLKQLQQLLGLYEIVARGQKTDLLRAPYLLMNRFIIQLATVVSELSEQSLYAALYARSLAWPEGAGIWSDPYMGGAELPSQHSEFIVTHEGEICLLEPLIETAINVLDQGHRDQRIIWQSNDPRLPSHQLPNHLLHSLCAHFPAFKAFYDYVQLAGDTPLKQLYALREGLRAGSIKGLNKEERGTEYDSGRAANEAIVTFSQWWTGILENSLKAQLSALTTGRFKRNLGELFGVILRDESADVIEDQEDLSTCVHILGNELEEAIKVNFTFLCTFEQISFTKDSLEHYKDEILLEFKSHGQKLSSAYDYVPALLVISQSPEQVPYFIYTISRLWMDFCTGQLSDNSLMECAALLPQLSETQREELWNFSYDFYHVEAVQLESLRALLSHLESKLQDNLLLPEEQKHALTSVEKALLSIIPYNYNLLAWVTQHYEYIVFTSRPLTELIINYGLTINVGKEQFYIREVYNFAYFMFNKTNELRHNLDLIQNKLFVDLFRNPKLELPIRFKINKDTLSVFKYLLSEHPDELTQVDWITGNSLLALAAEAGDKDLCQWLMEHEAPLYHRNKAGQLAEELWPRQPSTHDLMTYLVSLSSWRQYQRALSVDENPISTFRRDIIRLAQDHPMLSFERQEELWSLILKQESNLLTYVIDEQRDVNNFLYHAMVANKERILKRLTEHEQWPLWSRLRNTRGYTLLHIIARENHTLLYPYVQHIDINEVNNERRTSALACAAYEGALEFCYLLISNGASLDLQDINGNTALARASMRGHEQVCMLLIKQGARLDVNNLEGQTAEALWSSSTSTHSPFARLHDALYDLALHDAFEFTNEQEALLWLILVDNPRLLFLSLKPDPQKRHFLEIVFTRNNTAVIRRLSLHEQWPEWSQIKDSIKLQHVAEHLSTPQSREQVFDRKKTEILQIVERESPRSIWGFFKTNSVLDDLSQRIGQASLGFTSPHSLTAEHVLEEVLFQWEYEHSNIEGQKQVRFFAEDPTRKSQIERTVSAIKEVLSPGKERCENRV